MIIDTIVRKNIRDLKPYTSARDEYKGDSNMIFLDANENPNENSINRYPDPYQREIKELLSKQKNVKPSQILIGNGSDEVLDLIFRVFCEPNKDSVITFPPTYGMYEVLANTNAISVQKINLTEDFQINVSETIKAITPNTKLIFVCSPNNPTANTIAVKSIESLLTSFKGIVVIDEAYIDFSTETSWVNRLKDFSNLIITQTLSKAYGAAGIRLGVCYASEAIIAYLNKIKPPYNVNILSQRKALEVLNNENVKNQIGNILEERTNLIESLKTVQYISQVFPSDTNFILIKVDNANKRYKQLLEKGIVLRNRSNQPLCENCIRITIGTPEENKQLITILKSLK